ncbi:MAG: hypothetical protein ACLFRV_07515 [Acidimicrobiales bacterium]
MNDRQRRAALWGVIAVVGVVALLGGIAVGGALSDDDTDEVATPAGSTSTTSTSTTSTTTTSTTSTTDQTTTTTTTEAGSDSDDPTRTGGSEDDSGGDPGDGDVAPAGGETGACEDPHRQGTWDVDGPGDSGAVTSFDAVVGPCSGVSIGFEGAAPDVTVERFPAINTTVVELDHDGIPSGPVDPDFYDFDHFDEDRIWRAILAHRDTGLAVVMYHPPELGSDLGAHVDIDGDRMDITVRERTPEDPDPVGRYGGEPYQRTPRGPFWEGLLLDLAVDAEGSGTVVVQGYAKPFEGHLEVHLYDQRDATEVCGESTMTDGPMYIYSEYEVRCPGLDPGTYDVEVGWPGVAGPDDAVWHLDEVTVAG